jgi:hypothetical protein
MHVKRVVGGGEEVFVVDVQVLAREFTYSDSRATSILVPSSGNRRVAMRPMEILGKL